MQGTTQRECTQLPLPRPDETLYSLVTRIRRANGFRTDLHACQSLLGMSRVSRVDEYPVGLEHFAAVTHEAYGRAVAVLDTHTVAPYFRWTDRPPWHAGIHGLSPLQGRYGNGLLSHGASQCWRICTDCCHHELWVNGYSYWHCSHQLPCTHVCVVHKRPLAHLPPALLELHNRLYLPDELPNLPGQTHNAKAMERLLQLAQIESAMLNDHHTVQRGLGLDAIVRVLDQKGFLDNRKRLNRHALSDELRARHLPLGHGARARCSPVYSAIERCVESIATGRYPSATQFVFLIDYLFGSWEAFRQRITWEDVMNTLPAGAPEKTQSSEEATHRQVCLNLISSHPRILRSQFARAAPKSFRWLMKYDAEWFDGVLPQRPANAQRKLF